MTFELIQEADNPTLATALVDEDEEYERTIPTCCDYLVYRVYNTETVE